MCTIYNFQFYLYSICIQIFTIFTYVFYYSEFIISSNSETLYKYDFIIVGSGTAGSLIAHRLALETNYTYMVVEAGGPSVPLLDIPVIGPLLHGSVYDWHYETVSQDGACLGMIDMKCQIPQGKITGGSAKLNNMVHVRGNLSQYVDWFHGEYSHSYFEQQFEYIEKQILPKNDIKYESELADAILEAANELGYKTLNLNKNFGPGFMKSQVNQKYSKRWSTYHTFSQNNNKIIVNAEVEKVLIDSQNKAYGIEYVKMGKKHKIIAKKGVILSAGTLNTPKILQLSGIGPLDVLKKFGIPVIKVLPVGKNLQDHVTTGLDLILFNNSLKIKGFDLLNPFYMLEYFIFGTGPLTSPGCEVIGFLQTEINSSNPDIQFMVLPVGITTDRGSHLRKSLGLNNEIWNHYFVKIFNKYAVSILPILLHPKSRGEVVISSNDPKSPPLINPKYFSEKEDVDILVKGLEFVLKFSKTNSMKALGAHANENLLPGCQHLKIFSKPYWECYIKHLTLTSFHPIGTCKMGLPDSEHSVVDSYFRIIGVENLFVADGSVLPELPSGNVNASIAMMANIFFEQIIGRMGDFVDAKYCKRLDFLYEYLFKICINKVSL